VVRNIDYTAPGNATIAIFDLSTDYVSVTLGDLGEDQDDLFLKAYDSSNLLIGSAYFDNPLGSFAGTTLSVSSPIANIAWVEFYGVGSRNNSIYWDNFTFNMTPVPVPATLILLGTGLIGLAGIRKKYRLKTGNPSEMQ
jgi:hypothetical protein